MKRIILGLLLGLVLVGCEGRTEYGDCVGINDKQDSHLLYKVSVRNAFFGIVFIETIIVPIIVVADETYCPIERIN